MAQEIGLYTATKHIMKIIFNNQISLRCFIASADVEQGTTAACLGLGFYSLRSHDCWEASSGVSTTKAMISPPTRLENPNARWDAPLLPMMMAHGVTPCRLLFPSPWLSSSLLTMLFHTFLLFLFKMPHQALGPVNHTTHKMPSSSSTVLPIII